MQKMLFAAWCGATKSNTKVTVLGLDEMNKELSAEEWGWKPE